MPTFDVLDSTGVARTITVNPNSRAAAASSKPVALSNEDKSVLDAIETAVEAIVAAIPASRGQKAMASSLSVTLASDQTAIPVDAAALPAGTSRSGSIATGGTAQQLAPANATRRFLTIQNVSSENMGINDIGGTASIGAAGTWTLEPRQAYSVQTNRAVSVVAATTGSAWTAIEG